MGRYPVVNVPIGRAASGVPVGLQIVANTFDDLTAFQLASAYSQVAPPFLGVQIVLDMKPSGTADKWTGHIYNSDDGKTYRGDIALTTPTTLKVEGCVLAFCNAETWTRAE